jgi:hypothetical protein
MIAAKALLDALTDAGVTVRWQGARLHIAPASRIPATLRPALADRATLRALAGLVPHVLDPSEEAHAVRLGDALEAQYRAAAAVRMRHGTGWPGSHALDARHVAALEARAVAAAELLEERAAVREYDGGLDRAEAERLAARDVAAMLAGS